MPFRQIAKNLQIACSTAHRIYGKFEDTGEVFLARAKDRYNMRKLDEHHELLIIGLISENPCLYLRELRQLIFDATGVRTSGPTVCRVLRRNGFTRKKVQQVAKQRCMEYRALFMARALNFPSYMFVWIDQTGSDARANIRKFGYAVIGETPVYHRFLVRGKRMSAIAAICTEGLVDVELTTGSVDGDKFLDFVRGSLIPSMHPFDGVSSISIAILDNCTVHHVNEVKRMFEDAGILLLFLPPYSPDYNPIEQTFSSVKYYLKDHDELLQSTTDPKDIVHAAFTSITSENCKAWITNSVSKLLNQLCA